MHTCLGPTFFFRNLLSIVSIDSTPIHIDNNTLFNCIFFISFFFTLFKCKKNCFGLVKILSKFCVCFNFVNVVVYFHRNNSYSNNIKHKTQNTNIHTFCQHFPHLSHHNFWFNDNTQPKKKITQNSFQLSIFITHAFHSLIHIQKCSSRKKSPIKFNPIFLLFDSLFFHNIENGKTRENRTGG